MGILTWLRVQWDRAAAAAAVLLGLLALLLGWIGTSDALYVVQQVPYIVSGGLLGTFLLILGSVLWVSADLRDEWRELRALRELHAQHLGSLAATGLAEPVLAQPEPVVARGARRARTGRRPALTARAAAESGELS